MKRILILSLVLITFYSCENLEDNTPALQSTVDQEFFKAIDARATENEDGSFLIQAITNVESLNLRIPSGDPRVYVLGGTSPSYATFENALRIPSGDPRVYVLGGTSPSYATFENALGDTYTTDPDGGGSVVITNWDTTGKTLSGTFTFNAVLADRDTLFVEQGVFFQVPYGGLESIDDETPPNAGTFVARIDGVTFNPFTITAVGGPNAITIKGASTSKTVTLQLPEDIGVGGFTLPLDGFVATYMNNEINEEATEGNVTIFEHDIEQRRIKGTFSFRTPSSTVSLGQFNVRYQ